ncbi:MAG: hypothetical protein WC460_01955 [Patescibacteria group bacterium]
MLKIIFALVIINLSGEIITFLLIKQFFSGKIAEWRCALQAGSQTRATEDYPLYKEKDIEDYMRRRGRWTILLCTLLWPAFLRPQITRWFNAKK